MKQDQTQSVEQISRQRSQPGTIISAHGSDYVSIGQSMWPTKGGIVIADLVVSSSPLTGVELRDVKAIIRKVAVSEPPPPAALPNRQSRRAKKR